MIGAAPGKTSYPWQAAGVSGTHLISFNHRVREELVVKFKWLAAEKGLTMQEALEEAMERYFNQEGRMLGLET